jgi:hypothetical protein
VKQVVSARKTEKAARARNYTCLRATICVFIYHMTHVQSETIAAISNMPMTLGMKNTACFWLIG